MIDETERDRAQVEPSIESKPYKLVAGGLQPGQCRFQVIIKQGAMTKVGAYGVVLIPAE